MTIQEDRFVEDLNSGTLAVLKRKILEFANHIEYLPNSLRYICELVEFAARTKCDIYILLHDEKYYLRSLMSLTVAIPLLAKEKDATTWTIGHDSSRIDGFLGQFLSELTGKVITSDVFSEAKVVKSQETLKVTLIGSRTCEYRQSICSGISKYYIGPLSVDELRDDDINLAHFHKYGRSDILVFNWNKYAFMFRLFLRSNAGFRSNMVLYTGALAEYSSVKSTGIFNFTILYHRETSDDWGDVVKAVDDAVSIQTIDFHPAPYLRYHWGNHEMPPLSHFISVIRQLSRGSKEWGEVPENDVDDLFEHMLIHNFSSIWTAEIRNQGGSMEAMPIWGKPEYEKRKRGELSCFVLFPFREPFTIIYEDHIFPAVSSLGIRCAKADDCFTVNQVMNDIWNGINNADFIVAELTGRNPNVLYELGICHTLGKEVIMVNQNELDIPFDLRHMRYYLYEYTPRGCEKLRDSLQKTIRQLSL